MNDNTNTQLSDSITINGGLSDFLERIKQAIVDQGNATCASTIEAILISGDGSEGVTARVIAALVTLSHYIDFMEQRDIYLKNHVDQLESDLNSIKKDIVKLTNLLST